MQCFAVTAVDDVLQYMNWMHFLCKKLSIVALCAVGSYLQKGSPVHEPMQKLDPPLSDVIFRLSKVAFIDAPALIIELDPPIVLRPDCVILTLYQGEVHTWELLLRLGQATPGVASRPT